MALLAHYKCDNQDNGDTTLTDVSGHANNHDISITVGTNAVGFMHNRFETGGNSYSGDAANGADFVLTGTVTIMAWIEMHQLITYGDNPQYIIAHGDNGETQAENTLWALTLESDDSFAMRWEYSTGTDVSAKSPANAIELASGWGGQDHMIHVAVIRSINGSNRDVKFVLNGVDLSADVTGLTAPDGGTYSNAAVRVFSLPRAINSNRFEGAVADIRVYDTAESVSNILSVYNAEKANHLNSGRVGNSYDLMTNYDRGDQDGVIYTPAHTGTGIDDHVEGSYAGWGSERI